MGQEQRRPDGLAASRAMAIADDAYRTIQEDLEVIF